MSEETPPVVGLCAVCGRPSTECDGKTCEPELPQLAVKLALDVAESEFGQAGPGVARVLAFEVRRLRRDLEVFCDAGHAAELRVVELREGLVQLGLALKARATIHDADQVTLEQIEQVCTRHGYEPNSGQPVAEWIDGALSGEKT